MSDEQRKLLFRLAFDLGATKETARDRVLKALGVERLEWATRVDASKAIDLLKWDFGARSGNGHGLNGEHRMVPLEIPGKTSASQLTSYSICPRKYAFHYVYEREPEFTSTSLILGSAVHSTVGWWYEERLQGRTPPLGRARDIFVADLAAESATGHIRWKTATPDSLEAEGLGLLELYLAQYGDLAVSGVESPFEVNLEHPDTRELTGRPFRGFFDSVLRDGTVVELKTSSKSWSEFDLVRHLQVGGYAFALNALQGGPSKLEVHVLVRLKKEPRVETFRIERASSATRWWFQAARSIEAAIEDGHFPPKPSPLCRECEYETACVAWTGEAPLAAPPRRLPVVRESVVLEAGP